jgi:hypothetical protein
MNVNVMMMPWSQKFLAFDPSSPYVAHDIPILRQMPKEMPDNLGWHYEFERGFGILAQLLKKPRAQSPKTPETPERHKRW